MILVLITFFTMSMTKKSNLVTDFSFCTMGGVRHAKIFPFLDDFFCEKFFFQRNAGVVQLINHGAITRAIGKGYKVKYSHRSGDKISCSSTAAVRSGCGKVDQSDSSGVFRRV